jgi:hypothetical protein
VVIVDPKQISDPLSEALAAVATEVKDLKERVRKLEGNGGALASGADRLQSVIELDFQI